MKFLCYYIKKFLPVNLFFRKKKKKRKANLSAIKLDILVEKNSDLENLRRSFLRSPNHQRKLKTFKKYIIFVINLISKQRNTNKIIIKK